PPRVRRPFGVRVLVERCHRDHRVVAAPASVRLQPARDPNHHRQDIRGPGDMTIGRLRRLTTALLAAFVLGLLATPILYVVTGALGGFSTAFAAITLPPEVAAVGFLLWLYLGAASSQHRSTVVLRVLEVSSWAVCGVFLVLITAANLQTPVERLGASA